MVRIFRRGILRPVEAVGRWLDRVDPGTHRRIKGLRLVTAYGIAAALGTLQDIAHSVPSSISLGYLAGSFALWASVSEGKTTRAESSRDLLLLSLPPHWARPCSCFSFPAVGRLPGGRDRN